MKKIFPCVFLILLFSCKKEAMGLKTNLDKKISENSNSNALVKINIEENTIKERFAAPKDYTWVNENPHSFAYFIENFPLKKYGSPIMKYDRTEIATQDSHEAIFDIDTGTKDLQQCADAVIRLRAEYLFKNKMFEEIKFHFTNGDLMTWNDFKNGTRAFVNGNSVQFRKTAKFNDSYENFREYLNLIFNYAGTISLNKETTNVTKNEDLKTGDFIITPGSPGHVVFICGVAKNKKGKKLFLLAEGFTPAQSVHLLKNPFNPKISPWYELDVDSDEIKTARYYFSPGNFRSF